MTVRPGRLRSPSAAANLLSVASRMPFVLTVTVRMGGLREVDELQDVLVDGGLPAGEHHHLRFPLRGDEGVQHHRALLRSDGVAVGLMPGVGEADRAVQVAAGVDLDNAEAGVLLVLRAQAAVRRTAVLDLGLERQRERPRPVEPRRGHVGLRVPVHQRLERAVLAAALAQVDLPPANVHLRVDHHLAHRADALGVLDEHLVPIRHDYLHVASPVPASPAQQSGRPRQGRLSAARQSFHAHLVSCGRHRRAPAGLAVNLVVTLTVCAGGGDAIDYLLH